MRWIRIYCWPWSWSCRTKRMDGDQSMVFAKEGGEKECGTSYTASSDTVHIKIKED